MTKTILIVALVLPAFAGAQRTATVPNAPVDAAHYLDQYIDKTADPRQDFYQYSVGKWLKAHPIPAAERSWGIANVVQEETYTRVLAISRGAAADTKSAKGRNAQKIGDVWFSAMDSVTNAKQGVEPLAAEFARIADAKDLQSLLGDAAHLQYLGVNAFFNPSISQDEMNSDGMALYLFQGGLGLPDRDYYFGVVPGQPRPHEPIHHPPILSRIYVGEVFGSQFKFGALVIHQFWSVGND